MLQMFIFFNFRKKKFNLKGLFSGLQIEKFNLRGRFLNLRLKFQGKPGITRAKKPSRGNRDGMKSSI